MAIFFVADTHFGDDAIRRYENRPFSTVALMNEALIEYWNQVVGEQDEVYVPGDFGVPNAVMHILPQLNGTKYLIKGNHDTQSNEFYRKAGFKEVYDHPIILENFWIISHEPLYTCSNMPYANIFGHVHAAPYVKDFSAQHFCVSVERIGYAPISFDEIKRAVKEAAANGD